MAAFPRHCAPQEVQTGCEAVWRPPRGRDQEGERATRLPTEERATGLLQLPPSYRHILDCKASVATVSGGSYRWERLVANFVMGRLSDAGPFLRTLRAHMTLQFFPAYGLQGKLSDRTTSVLQLTRRANRPEVCVRSQLNFDSICGTFSRFASWPFASFPLLGAFRADTSFTLRVRATTLGRFAFRSRRSREIVEWIEFFGETLGQDC